MKKLVMALLSILVFSVFASGTKWPDLLVAVIISGLALSGAYKIIQSARKELKG